MKTLLQNPVFRFLSDMRLAAVLLLLIWAASAVATVLESYYAGVGSTETGRAAAYHLIYDAPWFNVLLVVLFVNVALNMLRRLARGWQWQSLGYLLVHVGILVILVGAGLTRWWGYEGYLRIREGKSNDVVASATTHAVVGLGDAEAGYRVRLYKPGPQGHHHDVTVGGETVTLGVAEYWTRFEQMLSPGRGDIARVVLNATGQGGTTSHALLAGDDARLGGYMVRFHRDDLPAVTGATGRYGDLRVHVGDQSCRLPIEPVPGHLGECGGWLFELTEFQADFKVGGESGPDGPLRNPMIRLEVTSPGGEMAEKILFALHPDFDTMHDATSSLLDDIDLLYELNRGVDLARQGDQVILRASFDLDVAAMSEGAETRRLPAGETTPLESGHIYRGDGGFQVVATAVETSLGWAPVQGDRATAPEAARLYLERDGDRAEAICVRGAEPQNVQLGGATYRLSFGSVESKLPYRLYLEDFLLTTHPGSDSPASYESHVVLEDPDRGVTDRKVRIWMNHPLNHRGTKHFQSSYDRDLLGTVLSINRDPGKLPTYIGYTLLTVGFLLVLVRVVGRYVKASQAAVGAGLLLLAAGALLPADAAAQGHGATGPPPTLNLSPQNLDAASRLVVQDYRGRMKPVDTLARETSIKISKRTSYEGREPVEMFLGFVAHPQAWYHYPFISVKNPGVQDLLGISHDKHHVAPAELLHNGAYRLDEAVDDAHRTPANRRHKTQQKLIVFTERVYMAFGALQGSSLRIFPLPDDPDHTWLDIDGVLQRLPEGDPRRAEFQAAADALFGGLAAGDQASIATGLRLTADLQHKYGAAVMPSDFRIDSELQLNSLNPFARSTLPYLLGFVLLIIAFFVGLLDRNGQPWSLRSPLYSVGMLAVAAGFALHLFGFVLRWIASGRAPLSNGHESLLWVALAAGLAGLLFEPVLRMAAVGALGALTASLFLGVSMMATFDPAIGPLVPVLNSYWLNIHVTIITASYGFLGLSCLLGLLVFWLFFSTWRKGQSAITTEVIDKLDRLNVAIMIAGLGLLAVGTLLGGVWANESWGRYWGWDPKETWALISVLWYAMVLHLRWIPKLANPWVQAAGAFMGIWFIIMTYFGVNYLLVGLHSYAAGESTGVPLWAALSFTGSLMLCVIAFFAWHDDARRRQAARQDTGS